VGEVAKIVKPLTGIHHVTAIAGDVQRNVDFYSGVLGLRLVKKTVNFDDPGSYHLYYGDRVGTPGTLVTFFIWPGMTSHRTGIGEPVRFAYRIPVNSASYWKQRLADAGASVQTETDDENNSTLRTLDPDGLIVELVEAPPNSSSAAVKYWQESGIPEKYSIQGFHSVTLAHRELKKSDHIFTHGLGFVNGPAGERRERFELGDSLVDVIPSETEKIGRTGAGTIHHVAFRVADDEAQLAWQRHIMELGLNVSPVMDRTYFHSIYFREPGGVLFEIATDGPGFAVDEEEASLGDSLQLPPQYESLRSKLEARLPKFALPQASAPGVVR
jgi:glyoxalase family protein